MSMFKPTSSHKFSRGTVKSQVVQVSLCYCSYNWKNVFYLWLLICEMGSAPPGTPPATESPLLTSVWGAQPIHPSSPLSWGLGLMSPSTGTSFHWLRPGQPCPLCRVHWVRKEKQLRTVNSVPIHSRWKPWLMQPFCMCSLSKIKYRRR
jgi:hypothetical protein